MISNVEFCESSGNFSERVRERTLLAKNTLEPIDAVQGTNNGFLTGSLRKYSYNPNGICGSVAAAIFLMYYDDYINGDFVTASYTSADGVSLIKYLVPHIEGSQGLNTSVQVSSTSADVVSGLNWYLSTRGLSGSYSTVLQSPGSFTTYCARIRANRPVIIDLDAHPTYVEHWVVGYGFTNRTTTKYAEVSDGWGNTAILINWNYVGDIIYLNN